MRIQVLSDLHLEFGPLILPTVDADVIVLAGDVGVGTQGLEWAAKAFAGKPIVYVAGNHEYYTGDYSRIRAALDATARNLGIHYLDPGALILEGVRFLGCTLWTDFDLFGEPQRSIAMRAAKDLMADYRAIRLDGHKLQPDHTRGMHAAQRQWLERELCKPAHGNWTKTVVVTHMLPSRRSVADRYLKNLSSAAFASNLDNLAQEACLWIHGHTHDSFDYQLHACRVVCNPRGYVSKRMGNENRLFRPELTVDV